MVLRQGPDPQVQLGLQVLLTPSHRSAAAEGGRTASASSSSSSSFIHVLTFLSSRRLMEELWEESDLHQQLSSSRSFFLRGSSKIKAVVDQMSELLQEARTLRFNSKRSILAPGWSF